MMDRPQTATRKRTLPSDHNLGRVLTISLWLTVAMPAMIVALSVPGLVLAFVAGLVATKVPAAFLAVTVWARRFRAARTSPGRPASQ